MSKKHLIWFVPLGVVIFALGFFVEEFPLALASALMGLMITIGLIRHSVLRWEERTAGKSDAKSDTDGNE